MENMDNLNEYELSALERKYKDDKLPRHRLYALVPYNIVFGIKYQFNDEICRWFIDILDIKF